MLNFILGNDQHSSSNVEKHSVPWYKSAWSPTAVTDVLRWVMRGLAEGYAQTTHKQQFFLRIKVWFCTVVSATLGNSRYNVFLVRFYKRLPSRNPSSRSLPNCELIISHFVKNFYSSPSRVKMGRMHAPGKGICASSLPL